MCRVLSYLGTPVLVDDLLYQSDSSLIRQTYDARMLAMLNLAGFGMAAWAPGHPRPDLPFVYRTTNVPIFDRNLKALAVKLRATSLIAHVRGVPYHEGVTVGEQNLHPFLFDGVPLALAHNGGLADFERMRFALLPHLRPEVAANIRGNTDSEWIYALVLSQFDRPAESHTAAEMGDAVESALRIIKQVRGAHGIATSSSVNLFLGDGLSLVAARFTFDFGCYPEGGGPGGVPQSAFSFLSLWYTMGRDYGLHEAEWKMVGGDRPPDSVLVASEPLTRDVSRWLEVPEYSLLQVGTDQGGLVIRRRDLDV